MADTVAAVMVDTAGDTMAGTVAVMVDIMEAMGITIMALARAIL